MRHQLLLTPVVIIFVECGGYGNWARPASAAVMRGASDTIWVSVWGGGGVGCFTAGGSDHGRERVEGAWEALREGYETCERLYDMESILCDTGVATGYTPLIPATTVRVCRALGGAHALVNRPHRCEGR